MSIRVAVLAIFIALVLFIESISAGNIGAKPKAKKIAIGYNGFNNDKDRGYAMATGGELGSVFYVTDAVDLARHFSYKGNKNPFICYVFADQDEWAAQDKVWVDPEQYKSEKSRNAAYPKAVLFAKHAPPPELGALQNVYQMGIRASEIKSLKITTECYSRDHFSANDHSTMDYPSLTGAWNIRNAAGVLGPGITGMWKAIWSALKWRRE